MTSGALAGEAQQLIFSIFSDYIDVCEERWRRWRSDYLEELRRRKYKNDPNAELHMRPGHFGDPLFFLWSIHNSWYEVFSDLAPLTPRDVRAAIRIRNLASHEPLEVTRSDVGMLESFHQSMRKLHGSPIGAPISNEWPPKVIPPPPTPARGSSQTRVEESRSGDRQVLPIYLVCDTSTSMVERGIDAVHDGIAEMCAVLASDPVILDKAMVGVISFSTSAQVEVPLSRVTDFPDNLQFEADGVTNYGRLFALLRETIGSDLAAMPAGLRPLRPVIFMLTDGDPTDKEWVTELDDLADAALEFAPLLVVFPCGFKSEAFARGVVSLKRALSPRIWPDGASLAVADALREAIASVTRSLIGTFRRNDDIIDLGF